MFTIDQAKKVLEDHSFEINPSNQSVQMGHAECLRLHELEALCALLRHETNNTAVGLEEHLALPTSHSGCHDPVVHPIMSYARLEAIVRQQYEKIISAVTTTMKEDVEQLKNPGSVPIYGNSVSDDNGSGLEFTRDNWDRLTSVELSYHANEMGNALMALGCSASTRIVAMGMLFSLVYATEQEKAITKIEKKYLTKPD
jgi:hypothetical protein